MSPLQAARCCRPVDGLLDPDWFKALCDPTRARLVGCLVKCGRACTVGEVAACCDVDLSVVSRHLRALELAGLLASSRQGRTVAYRVLYEEICRRLRDLADAIEECRPSGCCEPGRCTTGSCCRTDTPRPSGSRKGVRSGR